MLRYTTDRARPGLVALYDIWPGNGAGQFLQPRSLHGARVRQGGVLSPFLFSVSIDDLVKLVNKDNIGCRIGASCTAIFLYADDIILLASTICSSIAVVNICISELNYLDMAINVKKIGLRAFWSTI